MITNTNTVNQKQQQANYASPNLSHKLRILTILALTINLLTTFTSSSIFPQAEALTLTMMGRRKGRLQDQLSSKSMNRGNASKNTKDKGQLLLGVTFPEELKVKGWEFGDDKRMACARVEGKLYALEGECPRCGFDLYRGKVVYNEAFGDDPVLACPTCSTTYNLKTGKSGPPLKQEGLAGFVGRY